MSLFWGAMTSTCIIYCVQWNAIENHFFFLCSNEQLNNLVNEEINKLKDFIQNRTMATVPGNATIEEELYDAQVKYKSIITIDNIEIFVNLDEKALKYGR